MAQAPLQPRYGSGSAVRGTRAEDDAGLESKVERSDQDEGSEEEDPVWRGLHGALQGRRGWGKVGVPGLGCGTSVRSWHVGDKGTRWCARDDGFDDAVFQSQVEGFHTILSYCSCTGSAFASASALLCLNFTIKLSSSNHTFSSAALDSWWRICVMIRFPQQITRLCCRVQKVSASRSNARWPKEVRVVRSHHQRFCRGLDQRFQRGLWHSVSFKTHFEMLKRDQRANLCTKHI